MRQPSESKQQDTYTSSRLDAVLIATPWYRPTVGGVVEVADRLHQKLSEAGVETHLFVCEYHGSIGKITADPAGKNVWHFPVPCNVFGRFGFRTLAGTLIRGMAAFWRLFGFIRRHRVRTVLLLYPIEYAWLFVLLRRVSGIHLIASCHGNDLMKYDQYPSAQRWLLRRVLRAGDAITVCADHLARQIARILPGRSLPIRLIPNCVDARHFTPPPENFHRADSSPRLVHVSNFALKKRTLDIIEAFASAEIPSDSRLVMVGQGPDLSRATDRTKALGVADRVEFIGAVDDVRPYLWGSDLFVLASEAEGDPLALLEAMACGLAWISTPWGAAARLPGGDCGLVVPAGSPETLAAAIAELIHNSNRRRAMGLRARQWAEKDLTEEKYIQRHLELISEIGR